MLHRLGLGKHPFKFWLALKAERESAAAQRNYFILSVHTKRQDPRFPAGHRTGDARERLPGIPRCRQLEKPVCRRDACVPPAGPGHLWGCWQQNTEVSPPPPPSFTPMDFYSPDLQIRGCASIKPALANCSKSSNKSNAIPHPPSYCSCQAPVTTICGKILLTSALARVSSSASVKTAP